MRLKKLKTSEKRRMIKKPADAHDLQLLLLYPADQRSAQFETSFLAKFQPAVSLVPECQLTAKGCRGHIQTCSFAFVHLHSTCLCWAVPQNILCSIIP